MFLDDPSPPYSHYPPHPSPLVTVSLFFISKSLVLCCSLACFADQVPLIGEIIWYLSSTTWLTLLRSFFYFKNMKYFKQIKLYVIISCSAFKTFLLTMQSKKKIFYITFMGVHKNADS